MERDDVNELCLDEDKQILLKEKNESNICALASDIKTVLFEMRYCAPLILLMSIFFGYHMTVAPYHVHAPNINANSQSSLSLLRPVVSISNLMQIQQITLRAETHFTLPNGNDVVSVKFTPAVDKHGTHKLPSFFYEGVTFGVTSENSHSIEHTSFSLLGLDALRDDLESMAPRPTFIMNREASLNSSSLSWNETGLAVYFSYSDLLEAGKLSSDRSQPWKRVGEDVLSLARKFKQTYITVWYPHEFGKHVHAEQGATDPHKFKTVIQQTLPTRTGLGELKSTAVVWMSLLNRQPVGNTTQEFKSLFEVSS